MLWESPSWVCNVCTLLYWQVKPAEALLCHICDKCSPSWVCNVYTLLYWQVKPAEAHPCHICDKTFGTCELLDLHTRLHHCQDCGITVANVEDLIEHRKTHGLYCVVCNQVFKTERELHKHMKLFHPGISGSQCNMCGKVSILNCTILFSRVREGGLDTFY